MLLLPLILGAVVGFYLHDSIVLRLNLIQAPTPSQTAPNFDKSNNLRVDINSLYRENVILLTSALRRIYNKEPYVPDALEALQENTLDIADIIGNYYGPEVRSQYLGLWVSQNRAFVSYAEAVRDKDNNKKAAANKNLNDYVDASLSFWQKVNPQFDTTSYRPMLADRVSFLRNFVNDLDASNVSESFKDQHAAYQQNGKIADFLTLSIVKQFANKFK